MSSVCALPHLFWAKFSDASKFVVRSATIFAVITSLIICAASAAFGQDTNLDGPAELPKVYLQSDLADTPADGATLYVRAGGSLQNALNSANCGDTIQLQAGASFAGTVTLPAKSCDDQHWIIIRTSAADNSLSPEGTRITPCFAGVGSLPGRPRFDCASTANVMAKIILLQSQTSGPILLATGANHYRMVGLEITRLAGNGPEVALIQTNQNARADHIILDRMWIHGTAQDETRRGISLSGTTNVAIVDSYFSDFHCNSIGGSCLDSQAISGGSSDFPAGPYKIVNNFLEASGECILFGGGPSTTTPQDIEIRRNHLFKPLIWMSGTHGFVGSKTGNPFIVKNHFELKNAVRVLFEGNILENNWGGFTQNGFSIVLTPKGYTTGKDTSDNLCPVCEVTDVTIRYNTIDHVGAGFAIATALTVGGGLGAPAMAGARYSIHDVILSDISSANYTGTGTLLLLSNGWTHNVLNNVRVEHITGFADQHLITLENDNNNPPMSGFVFANNLVNIDTYPVWPAGGGKTNCAKSGIPILEIVSCFKTYTFESNVMIGSPTRYPPSTWPTDNHFVANVAAVGFVDYADQNYGLLPSSPFQNAGTDGKDIGADINAIQTAIAGVY